MTTLRMKEHWHGQRSTAKTVSYTHLDFGDSIRFGAATAAEDEKDVSKMEVSLERFRAFTRGYTRSCTNLTKSEIACLAIGAKTMTMECGVRFLTDYLEDVYKRQARACNGGYYGVSE